MTVKSGDRNQPGNYLLELYKLKISFDSAVHRNLWMTQSQSVKWFPLIPVFQGQDQF